MASDTENNGRDFDAASKQATQATSVAANLAGLRLFDTHAILTHTDIHLARSLIHGAPPRTLLGGTLKLDQYSHGLSGDLTQWTSLNDKIAKAAAVKPDKLLDDGVTVNDHLKKMRSESADIMERITFRTATMMATSRALREGRHVNDAQMAADKSGYLDGIARTLIDVAKGVTAGGMISHYPLARRAVGEAVAAYRYNSATDAPAYGEAVRLLTKLGGVARPNPLTGFIGSLFGRNPTFVPL